jgi:hypothetical protein
LARAAEQKELSWEEAIQTVLQRADGPLHYADIAEWISSKRLKQKIGANPAATVASVLSRSLTDESSPFQRIRKGEYALKHKLVSAATPRASDVDPDQEPAEAGALRAFGMFWQRSLVNWGGKPKLLGRQQLGASEVNFNEQVGVYLLHDRERVIYVGRASDTLLARLKMHTLDRLGGRWDRFSWYGLKSVGQDGSLADPAEGWSHDVVIETMEALLIESLEPPLNRKRGDNFSGVEYLQVTDPEIEDQRKKQLIKDILRQSGLGDG